MESINLFHHSNSLEVRVPRIEVLHHIIMASVKQEKFVDNNEIRLIFVDFLKIIFFMESENIKANCNLNLN